ncbi:MAG: triose-phosphate isomerase [Clostridia bacterium]
MEKLYIGTNTKMYMSLAETTDYLVRLSQVTTDLCRDDFELFVIPSFTSLQAARSCVAKEQITVGAQNIAWEDMGQFTGEISPVMLKEIGVEIAEIGHSERRHILHETDEEENRKVLCAMRHGLRPLLCIGETGQQKEQGISDEILRIQLKIGLHNVPLQNVEKLLVAYEPVWAIGVNGTPASAEYVHDKHGIIRKTLQELFGKKGDCVPVLYGGSVNNANCEELIVLPNVDGLFIGRSAWNAENFDTIIRMTIKKWKTKG